MFSFQLEGGGWKWNSIVDHSIPIPIPIPIAIALQYPIAGIIRRTCIILICWWIGITSNKFVIIVLLVMNALFALIIALPRKYSFLERNYTTPSSHGKSHQETIIYIQKYINSLDLIRLLVCLDYISLQHIQKNYQVWARILFFLLAKTFILWK